MLEQSGKKRFVFLREFFSHSREFLIPFISLIVKKILDGRKK
jgi:ribosomal 30S subunit maturation factor RimM